MAAGPRGHPRGTTRYYRPCHRHSRPPQPQPPPPTPAWPSPHGTGGGEASRNGGGSAGGGTPGPERPGWEMESAAGGGERPLRVESEHTSSPWVDSVRRPRRIRQRHCCCHKEPCTNKGRTGGDLFLFLLSSWHACPLTFVLSWKFLFPEQQVHGTDDPSGQGVVPPSQRSKRSKIQLNSAGRTQKGYLLPYYKVGFARRLHRAARSLTSSCRRDDAAAPRDPAVLTRILDALGQCSLRQKMSRLVRQLRQVWGVLREVVGLAKWHWLRHLRL